MEEVSFLTSARISLCCAAAWAMRASATIKIAPAMNQTPKVASETNIVLATATNKADRTSKIIINRTSRFELEYTKPV